MSRGDVETFCEDGQWKCRVVGNQRPSSVHATKAAAVTAGRQMAFGRQVDHIIRRADGTIAERHSYGRSSSPPST